MLSEENSKIVDGQMKVWIDDYKSKHGQGPSGRDQMAHRQRLELQFEPLSFLIKKMLSIGNPDSLDARRGSGDEFDRISAEIDRRETIYLKKS